MSTLRPDETKSGFDSSTCASVVPPIPLRATTSWPSSSEFGEQSDTESDTDSPTDPTSQLRNILRKGVSVELVQQLLDKQADPNASMQYKQSKEMQGTVFTLAAGMCRKDVVIALAHGRADVNSRYSFVAGAERVCWSGPAICATISRKSVSMMRLLVDLRADVNGRLCKFGNEPNGSLLYQACYVGSASCVRFLLERTTRKELNISVMSQDDKSKTHSPLSIASHRGHGEVVKLLLDHRADIGKSVLGSGPSMLADAIHMYHLDVVRRLVMASADIFSPSGPNQERGLDYILRSERSNSVIMAAVAQGLKFSNNENNMRNLRIEDIERFLWTENPQEILDVIFQPRVVQTWIAQPGSSRPMRKEWRTAHISQSKIRLNVAVGPDIQVFRQRFTDVMQNFLATSTLEKSPTRALLDMSGKYEKEFLEKLTNCYSSTKRRQAPAEFCQCLVPYLHDDVEVILALAKGPNPAVLDHPGAQAIVLHGWKQVANLYQNTFLYNVALAILFFIMSALLQQEQSDSIVMWKWVVFCAMLTLSYRSIFYEIMQMVGFIILGHSETYFTALDNYLDLLRIVITIGAYIIIVNSESWKLNDTFELKTVLAYTMWLRWIKVLYSARGFEASGQHIAAIMHAVGSVWPFLSVVMWPLLGFINCYYMIGVYDLWRSAIIVYRMAFVGDFDLEEVEDIDPTLEAEGNPLSDGYYQELDPALSDKNKIIGVFVVIVTMFFTIVLMNIFIGVLSERYHHYFGVRGRLFLQTRANIVLEHKSISRATDALTARLCCSRRRIIPEPDPEMIQPEYLWFCRPTKADELGLSCGDDEEDAEAATSDRLESMRIEIERLKEQMSTFLLSPLIASTLNRNDSAEPRRSISSLI